MDYHLHMEQINVTYLTTPTASTLTVTDNFETELELIQDLPLLNDIIDEMEIDHSDLATSDETECELYEVADEVYLVHLKGVNVV